MGAAENELRATQKQFARLFATTLELDLQQNFTAPIRPPGIAYCRSFCSANSDTIREKIGRHVNFPSWSLDTIPGRTSISWPTCKTKQIRELKSALWSATISQCVWFEVCIVTVPPGEVCLGWVSLHAKSEPQQARRKNRRKHNYHEHSSENTATSYTAPQVFHFTTRFVYVKRSDHWKCQENNFTATCRQVKEPDNAFAFNRMRGLGIVNTSSQSRPRTKGIVRIFASSLKRSLTNEPGFSSEIPHGNRYLLGYVFTDGIDVVFQLRGDGNNRRSFSNRSCKLWNKLWIFSFHKRKTKGKSAWKRTGEMTCFAIWPCRHLPCTKAMICSCWSCAWLSFTKSILFWRIIMCFNFMISMAAKCSDVCGWGQDSFPAEKKKNGLLLVFWVPIVRLTTQSCCGCNILTNE